MKTSLDPRHRKRQRLIQELFSIDFQKQPVSRETKTVLIEKTEPQNVIIDEAVELAKEFGNNTSPAFINGVLGHILSYAKST